MAFLYPSFLFALIAIGIPIVLHLIQLRRAKRILFSNLKFIQESRDITASQRNIKEWLILLCRILFIFFLVSAFAQPFIPADNNGSGADTSEVKLILDNSYSMQQVKPGQDQTLLEAEAALAKTIISLFPQHTSFSIKTTANFNKDKLQKQEATDQIDKFGFSGNTVSGIFGNVDPRSTIFLLSDFQKSRINASVFNQLDSSALVHLVPLNNGESNNISVDSVYLEDEFIRTEVENTLHVVLRNTGSADAADVPVKFFIDEAQVAVLSMDVAANQSKEATFTFRLTDAGPKTARISIENHPVSFDNIYFFSLTPSAPISIVSIGQGAANTLGSLYKAEPFFRYAAYAPDQVDYSKVALADVIILKNIDNLATGMAATVANYVKDGGTLVIIPPAGDNPEGYTSLFQHLNIPATLHTANQQSPKTTLLAPNTADSFFKGIFSEFDPKMQMPEAVRTVSWSQASEDILKYRGGTPFLSRFERGRGQVYLLAAPLEQEYNTLETHAMLVPVFYKMALSGYKQEQQLAYTLRKETIAVPVSTSGKQEGIYELQKDSVAFIPEQQVRGGTLYFTIPSAVEEAGFYTLMHQNSAIAKLAFNYDRAESELAQFSPDELRAMLGQKYKNVHVYDYSDSFTVKGEFEKRYLGVKLWKYCLILCLFFLMAEIALIRLL